MTQPDALNVVQTACSAAEPSPAMAENALRTLRDIEQGRIPANHVVIREAVHLALQHIVGLKGELATLRGKAQESAQTADYSSEMAYRAEFGGA